MQKGCPGLHHSIINIFYLPAVANDPNYLVYRNHVGKILEITNDEPVHFTGRPYTFIADASIDPIKIEREKITTAPLIAYQVPYYLTRSNGHIMKFDTTLKKGVFYLAHEPDVKIEGEEILYRFRDNWIGEDLVLFRN